MWQPPPITCQSLRRAVRDAPAGASLALPPGEYEGPVVLDKPMHLLGGSEHDYPPTIYARHGPALIVRSPGVSLEYLEIMVTCAPDPQQDVAIWYAPGCAPKTGRVQIRGRVEEMGASQSGGGWNLPNLIDLGDIRARVAMSLKMVIEVPGPARLYSELSGLDVAPCGLAAAGQHVIEVSIAKDRLAKDTLLAGQLVIESGSETRAVWIIGRVLEDEFKDWIRDRIILITQRGRKIGFASGMTLGKEQLRGEPGAEQLADRHAFILHEAEAGVWSLVQPLPVVPPTKLNGQPVGVGRRVLLRGGETIEIGTLKLQVEAKQTQLSIVAADPVDFGRLSQPIAPAVTVQNQNKRDKWEGTLRSTVPWIQVAQPQVVCNAGGSTQVSVRLGPGTKVLPRSQITWSGALLLEGKAESLAISAVLNVDVEEGLQIEPGLLDFGQVSDPSVVPPRQVRVRNTGGAAWQGSVQVCVPWLAADETTLQIQAGCDAPLTVHLTPQLLALPDGPLAVAEAIKVSGQGLSASVSGRLEFLKPKVQLEVQPRSVDWGKVLDWRAAPEQKLSVQNTGNKEWQGKVVSLVPWIEATPAALRCPPGGKAGVVLRLAAGIQSLLSGDHSSAAALRVEGEGVSIPVAARLVLELPTIVPDKTTLSVLLEDRSILPRATLRLGNRSAVDWIGTVRSTLPWLEVSPKDIVCRAGGEATLEISVTQKAVEAFKKPRSLQIPDAIHIEGAGAAITVGVHLEVREPKAAASPGLLVPETVKSASRGPRQPRPVPVKPPGAEGASDQKLHGAPEKEQEQGGSSGMAPSVLSVDFGTVSGWSSPLPSQELRLKNTQEQPMEGLVSSTLPWLEVTPERFTCAPGEEVTLTLRLTRAAAKLAARPYEVSDAVQIECGSRTLQVTARLVVGRPATAAGPADKKLKGQEPGAGPGVLGFGTIQDWGSLPRPLVYPARNLQAAPVQGTARSTLPWLEVTPTSFALAAGQEQRLTVRLTQEVKKLRNKSYAVPDAIEIELGGQASRVEVRLVVDIGAKPSRQVTVKPDSGPAPAAEPPKEAGPMVVDFGTIRVWGSSLPSQPLRMTNSRPKAVSGAARSTLPWLEVTPARFEIPPGTELALTLALTKEATKLRSKQYDVPDAVEIEYGGQKLLVDVRLNVSTGFRTILAPDAGSAGGGVPPPSWTPGQPVRQPPSPALPEELVVQPSSVDMGTIHAGASSLVPQEIVLTNGLKVAWTGTLRTTVPWLQVTPVDLTLSPGSSARLKVSLTPVASRLRPRVYSAPDGITIEGGTQKVHVEARVTVV